MMRKYYVVEVLFSLVLFTVFVIGASFIVFYGARNYKSIVDDQEAQKQLRMSVAYISTKVHQAPSASSLHVKEIDNIECLVIEESIDGIMYSTIIYYQDEYIWELFTENDRIELKSASKIMGISNLSISQQKEQLSVTATNNLNQTQTLVLNPR